jgi:hypothetical protein
MRVSVLFLTNRSCVYLRLEICSDTCLHVILICSDTCFLSFDIIIFTHISEFWFNLPMQLLPLPTKSISQSFLHWQRMYAGHDHL